MTNLEKIKLIIGDENFKKLEKNFNNYKSKKHHSIEALIEKRGEIALGSAFFWANTGEGHDFWRDLGLKIQREWDIVGLREISSEEHELIFKMFVCEFAGFSANEYLIDSMETGFFIKRLYEALKCEE